MNLFDPLQMLSNVTVFEDLFITLYLYIKSPLPSFSLSLSLSHSLTHNQYDSFSYDISQQLRLTRVHELHLYADRASLCSDSQ